MVRKFDTLRFLFRIADKKRRRLPYVVAIRRAVFVVRQDNFAYNVG